MELIRKHVEIVAISKSDLITLINATFFKDELTHVTEMELKHYDVGLVYELRIAPNEE